MWLRRATLDQRRPLTGAGCGGCGPLLIGQFGNRVPLGDPIAAFTLAACGRVIVTALILSGTRGRVLSSAA